MRVYEYEWVCRTTIGVYDYDRCLGVRISVCTITTDFEYLLRSYQVKTRPPVLPSLNLCYVCIKYVKKVYQHTTVNKYL